MRWARREADGGVVRPRAERALQAESWNACCFSQHLGNFPSPNTSRTSRRARMAQADWKPAGLVAPAPGTERGRRLLLAGHTGESLFHAPPCPPPSPPANPGAPGSAAGAKGTLGAAAIGPSSTARDRPGPHQVLTAHDSFVFRYRPDAQGWASCCTRTGTRR